MRAVLQRVSRSRVSVDGETTGAIGPGILVLLGVKTGDKELDATHLLEKTVNLRIFDDEAGKMNRSLRDIGGALLAVPQFTLVADTNAGTRPSFSSGASPADGERLFGYFAKKSGAATGRFGADMKVSLVNDGPVTFWLQVAPPNKS